MDGLYCIVVVDACTGGPCLNGATCTVDVVKDEANCTCFGAWGGDFCTGVYA